MSPWSSGAGLVISCGCTPLASGAAVKDRLLPFFVDILAEVTFLSLPCAQQRNIHEYDLYTGNTENTQGRFDLCVQLCVFFSFFLLMTPKPVDNLES